MPQLDSQHLNFDDASGTLTVRNLVVTNELNSAGAVSGGATETISANDTMAEGDSGSVKRIDTDGVVITLPATDVGLTLTFVNAGEDGAVGFSVSPAAADKIQGAGFTSADNKDITNTKATAKKGDFVRLVADGAEGWYIQAMRGVFAREA